MPVKYVSLVGNSSTTTKGSIVEKTEYYYLYRSRTIRDYDKAHDLAATIKGSWVSWNQNTPQIEGWVRSPGVQRFVPVCRVRICDVPEMPWNCFLRRGADVDRLTG